MHGKKSRRRSSWPVDSCRLNPLCFFVWPRGFCIPRLLALSLLGSDRVRLFPSLQFYYTLVYPICSAGSLILGHRFVDSLGEGAATSMASSVPKVVAISLNRASSWWEGAENSVRLQDWIFHTLAALYGIVAAVALVIFRPSSFSP